MGRRRPSLKILAGTSLLLVLVLAAAAITVRTAWFERWLAAQVAPRIAEQVHERVEIDRIRLAWWRAGVTVFDLQIRHHKTGLPLVIVERAEADLALRSGRVKLGRVALVRPVVRLDLDERGRLDAFRAPKPRTVGPMEVPSSLPFERIELHQGSFTLGFPEGHVRLTRLDLVPRADGTTDIEGRIDVTWRDFADHAPIAWYGAELGPDRIGLPPARLPFDSLEVEASAIWPLDEEIKARVQIWGALASFSVLLPPPRYLGGAASIDVEVGGTLDAPRADAVVQIDDLAYEAPGIVWPIVRYRVDQIRAELTATPSEVTIHELFVHEDGGEVFATGVLANVDRGLGPAWELTRSEVQAEHVSLAAILRAAGSAPNPWVDFRGDAQVSLEGPLSPLLLEGPFFVQVSDFEVRQGPVDQLASELNLAIPYAETSGTLSITKENLTLDARRFVSARNRGTVRASIGYKPQGPLDLQIDLSRADLSEIRPLGGSAMFGRGTLRGRLYGDFNDLRARAHGKMSGFEVGGLAYADTLDAQIRTDLKVLELDEVVATKGSTTYTGRFAMDFIRPGLPMQTEVALRRGRIEDLLRVFLDLGDRVVGEVDRGTLWLDGPINDLDGEADMLLADVGLLCERFPTGRARGRLHQGTFTLDELSVRRGSEEGLDVRGSVGRGWALDMVASGELELSTLDALQEAGLDLGGRTSLLFKLDNTLLDPAPHGRIRVWNTRLGEVQLPDSVVNLHTLDGVVQGRGALLDESVSISLSAGLWGEQPYDLRAQLDELPIDLLYPVAADGRAIELRLSGDVVVSGHGGETPSPVEILGVFPQARFQWGDHLLASSPENPWRLQVEGDRWELKDVELAGGRSQIRLVGSGDANAALLDGTGQLDADLLRMFVPGLERADGTLDVDFTSRGGRSTRIDLSLDAALLRHESVPSAFEDLHLDAFLGPDRFVLTHFASDLGGGRVVGDARRLPRLSATLPSQPERRPLGVIEAEDWVPQRFDLLASAENVQMQWVEDLPPAVGDARLAFDGPADNLLLHADIGVTEMAFTERIEWEEWVVALEDYLLVEAPPTDEPPWFGLDINIRADRTVRLLNNVSDATASADLKLSGTTSRMGMTGRVRVDEGMVFVQDRAFDVLRGELRFDNPYAWDPLLDFDLRTDIQSRSRQYRINYRITGPYSAWNSRTMSEPRLPQADINALLWFGVTADELEDMGELTSAVGLAAADFVFKDFVANDYLGLGLRDTTLFDRLPRIEINTGVNLRGEYSSEPRALIRQRWSPTLSTQAEINLVRDDHFARLDWRAEESLLLSSWWASRRREGLRIPVSGALGVDLRWVLEFD
ncbi:MAG: hypothetical protein EA397_07475 [Deltaproteobacteria bacterium]|nr:MAG: hypothetical protein EA397_07475 [Deltaproteobacteria bacterium]